MTAIKSFTSVEQSRKLAEILPLESADFHFSANLSEKGYLEKPIWGNPESANYHAFPCWSLSALLEYMNHHSYNISLKCSGVEYTITFDDGKIYKTITRDYAIDAAVEMVIWINRLKEIIKAYIGSRDNVYEYVIRKLREDVDEEF